MMLSYGYLPIYGFLLSLLSCVVVVVAVVPSVVINHTRPAGGCLINSALLSLKLKYLANFPIPQKYTQLAQNTTFFFVHSPSAVFQRYSCKRWALHVHRITLSSECRKSLSFHHNLSLSNPGSPFIVASVAINFFGDPCNEAPYPNT